MCKQRLAASLVTNARCSSGQVEMQRNPQVFCRFDTCHELSEHAALPETVWGWRTWEEVAARASLALELMWGECAKHRVDSGFWIKSLELCVSPKRILLLQDLFN